ncbi:probable plastid-lipid-associated protein 10, chloroplastic isoform X1 [Trifolium pratense]|uniref:probable plastid-lipid-associated protein 10, chloroplastic isoform X1 n=1 Tax=Trifolium pratense TaxID=57577 RepID=UPI001E692049|nr:probable plastid-lipid-associated protein 10, chloroplastic isoform X1 [Trifolium pratense]
MGMDLVFNSSSPVPPLLCSSSSRRHTHNNYNFNFKCSSNVVNRRRRKLLSISMAMPSAAQVRFPFFFIHSLNSIGSLLHSFITNFFCCFNLKAYDSELENKKHELLTSVRDTQRGLLTTPLQRSSIEEALVNVEGTNLGHPIDLNNLDGTWRLQYTSASDVLILFQAAATLPFFQVGQIFQKFECRDNSNGGGVIRNIVQWSIPNLLEEQEGATLLVSAKFTLVSVRNIYLQFQEITVQDINISEQLQALIAPAILPRSFINLQILQYLRAFKAQIPVSPGRESVGGLYYLSYLDDNMLLGRAVGGGGVFVFTRAQSLY